MPSPSLTNEYPIELTAPDITPFRKGNTGLDYITTLDSGHAGPHAMISAIVHGNELCGPIALEKLFNDGVQPVRGKLTLGLLNVAAYDLYDADDPFASRWVDEDFNRIWSPEVLKSDRTSVELERARQIVPLLESVDLLLDIHSMQTLAPPVILTGTLPKGRELARAIGVPELVVADEGHAAGRRMRDFNEFADAASPKKSVLIECGQHWEAAAGDLAILSSILFLRAAGIMDEKFGEEVASKTYSGQKLIEITEAVTIETDEFTFARTFAGGEVLPDEGTLIGHDGDHKILTPHDDCVLIMPTRRTYKGQTAVRLGRFIED